MENNNEVERAKANGWILTTEKRPNIGDNVEYSNDGETEEGTLDYTDSRRCMMAGIAGGHGYFGEGFATDGENGCDIGLICDDPKYWRYAEHPESKTAQQFKPCGSDDNICNCKNESECGYTEMAEHHNLSNLIDSVSAVEAAGKSLCAYEEGVSLSGFISQPIQLAWKPKEDITAYELAMCLPILLHGHIYTELPDDPHFRHFEVNKQPPY